MSRGVIGTNVALDVAGRDEDMWSLELKVAQDLGFQALRVSLSFWDMDSQDARGWARERLQQARDHGFRIMLTFAQLVGNDPDATNAVAVPDAVETGIMLWEIGAGLVDWVQILNEWDAQDWKDWDRSLGDADANPPRPLADEEYLHGVRDVITGIRTHIHRTHPDVLVHTATTGVGMATDAERLWQRMHGPLLDVVDAIGINGYPITWAEKYHEMPARLRRTAEWAGKPIVMPEIGLPVGGDISELDQGEWIAHQIDRATRCGDVLGVWLYELRDAGTDASDMEQTFGLLHHDGTPKAGYRTVRAMIRSITGQLLEPHEMLVKGRM